MVMQATMIGVLLAAVGAAAMLGRSRERRWAIELNTKPHLADRLAIRLPRGWNVDESNEPGAQLVVTATQHAAGRDVRTVEITQFTTGLQDEASLLAAYLSQRPGVTGAIRPMRFLGRPGVVAPFIWHRSEPDNPLAPTLEIPEWYAAAVVPREGAGNGNLAVVVGLVGVPGAAGRSAKRLIQEVSGGLSLRGGGARGAP